MEHSVNGVKEFAHDGADDLHGGFTARGEVVSVGLDVGVMGFGGQPA